MSLKTNHRSIRYSDEVAAIVTGFGSPTAKFNDKLEQLILHCNLALPQIDAELARKRLELKKLEEECQAAKKKAYDHRVLKNELDVLMVECNRLNKRLKDITDIL